MEHPREGGMGNRFKLEVDLSSFGFQGILRKWGHIRTRNGVETKNLKQTQ